MESNKQKITKQALTDYFESLDTTGVEKSFDQIMQEAARHFDTSAIVIRKLIGDWESGKAVRPVGEIKETKSNKIYILALRNVYSDLIESSRELEEYFDRLINKLEDHKASGDICREIVKCLCERIEATAEDEQRMNEESPQVTKPDGKARSTRLFELKKKVEKICTDTGIQDL